MTQYERVLDYMQRFGSITPLDAYRDLGIMRLAAIICDMRKDGICIYGEYETSKNRFGDNTRYMHYSLKERS